jgi:glutaredoxin
MVFFYSNKCSHCEKVEAFFNAKDVRNKIIFAEKEVSQNRDNLIELVKMQKRCGIPVKDYVEVPLLWTGKKCITGDQDIIKFFKGKIEK